jgi:hypothetical protein
MLVPAYIKSRQLQIPETGGELHIVPLLIMTGIVACGYVINTFKGE